MASGVESVHLFVQRAEHLPNLDGPADVSDPYVYVTVDGKMVLFLFLFSFSFSKTPKVFFFYCRQEDLRS